MRYRLRTLLIVVTVIGIWLGLRVSAARRQSRAVQEIKALGGTCYYDFEYDFKEGRRLPNAKSWMAKWIVDRTGIDLFHHVVQVNMVFDAEGSSDRPQRHNEHLTDAFKSQLAAFPKLRDLLFYKEQATDDCLAAVSRMKHLERLTCWDADLVTDAGAEHLAQLPRLRILNLTGAKITDESLRHFGAMRQLEDLNVQMGRITDRGLAHLTNLTRLKYLAVDNGDTNISDAGLAHLEGLQNLEVLWVQKTKVTPNGIARLQSAVPKLTTVLATPSQDDGGQVDPE